MKKRNDDQQVADQPADTEEHKHKYQYKVYFGDQSQWTWWTADGHNYSDGGVLIFRRDDPAFSLWIPRERVWVRTAHG